VVRAAVAVDGRFEMIAEAADGTEALREARECQPDAIILDLGLPDITGVDLLPQLRAVAPHAKIVIFTGTQSLVGPGTESADALVLKDVEIAVLLDAIADVTADTSSEAAVEVEPAITSVAAVRAFTTRNMAAFDCDDHADDAALIISELATNAVVHARTRYRVTMRRRRRAVRLEVTDRVMTMPDPQDEDHDREGGRGLHLISALAIAWGVDPRVDGKTVWAELPCPERQHRRSA